MTNELQTTIKNTLIHIHKQRIEKENPPKIVICKKNEYHNAIHADAIASIGDIEIPIHIAMLKKKSI